MFLANEYISIKSGKGASIYNLLSNDSGKNVYVKNKCGKMLWKGWAV